MGENSVHLYSDLAWLWPLWGDMGDYAAWCQQAAHLIRQYGRRDVRTILNLGCGGGKNAYNLKQEFAVTGVDISPAMLDQAKRLNPECDFRLGDMRDCSLGQEFDAVLVDDAISYMASRADLIAVFRNAYRHLRAGGVMIVEPDATRETFRQNHTEITFANPNVKPAHVQVVFVENLYDPDPADDVCEGTIVYLIREHGNLRIETDHSLLGLFSIEVWRAVLREVGFLVYEHASGEGEGRTVFACVK